MEEELSKHLNYLVFQIKDHMENVNSGRFYANINHVPQSLHKDLIKELKSIFNNDLIGIDYYEGAFSEGHSYTLDVPYGEKFNQYKTRKNLINKEVAVGCCVGILALLCFAIPIIMALLFHHLVLGLFLFPILILIVGPICERIANRN